MLRGRRTECEVLDGVLERVRGGRSSVLVVRGEAGIGKTALLEYLVGAAAGFRVIRASGVESEMELPFAGLHEVCAPMLGRLGLLAEPQRLALSVAFGMAAGDAPDRFLIALAALSLVAETAEEQPLLCVVDDAQWLDQASAQVFGFVGRRLLAESIALVVAARTPVPHPDPLAGCGELHLGGLDAGAARALLAEVAPGPLDESVRARILDETVGNPLALLELGRSKLAGGFAVPGGGDLSKRIEDEYVERLRELPPEAQTLALLAAADPVGDFAVLLRAAQTLGHDIGAVGGIRAAGLFEIGTSVRFRHPLVRSAAYRAASSEDRRAAHAALAGATDPEADADRRAWHRAHAAAGPDEAVARELISSADRARRRGGVAAAAAFLARAATLTPDGGERAARSLTAAEAWCAAGDFEAAQALLVAAELGPLDELGSAQVQRLRAQIAFVRRGSDAPALLLRAAQRLEPVDGGMARRTYLEALLAAIRAGRLGYDDESSGVASAVRSAPVGPEPVPHSQLLLRGLSVRMTDGYVDAAPLLKEALLRYRAEPPDLDWQCLAYSLVAMDLWDDDGWFDVTSGHVAAARAQGALSWLPSLLHYLGAFHVQAGELVKAENLLVELERIEREIRATTLPHGKLLLAAARGDAPAALELADVVKTGAAASGQGAAMTYVEYSKALLYNGLGDYVLAAEAAHDAVAVDELVLSPWALFELVEAAVRSDQPERASTAAGRLLAIAAVSGSDWARGAAARSGALLAEGRPAEDLHREAIELLGRTRMAFHAARARLTYGEWLRRENRRVDARDQLRLAFEAFTSMGSHAFGERARRELSATGEKVRRRDDSTRADLTPQEEEIAQLARERRSNPEIGAQLFLSARTVEWHLRKVFAKLEISSRRELDEALKRREQSFNRT
jgi:DNA-binding CsgD family transcriptional regulator